MDDDELDALMELDDLDEWATGSQCECTRCGPPLAGGGRRCPMILVPLFAVMSYNADGRIICPSCRVHSFFKPFKCYACVILGTWVAEVFSHRSDADGLPLARWRNIAAFLGTDWHPTTFDC